MQVEFNEEKIRHYVENLGTKNEPLYTVTRSGELRMQKLKSHLLRTQSLNVLPL